MIGRRGSQAVCPSRIAHSLISSHLPTTSSHGGREATRLSISSAPPPSNLISLQPPKFSLFLERPPSLVGVHMQAQVGSSSRFYTYAGFVADDDARFCTVCCCCCCYEGAERPGTCSKKKQPPASQPFGELSFLNFSSRT